jgi:hypothetical protein
MQVLESIQQLVCPRQHFSDSERPPPLLEEFAKFVPWDALHDKKLALAFEEVVYDDSQGGMSQVGQRTGFARELIPQGGVADERLFQGHLGAKSLIHGKVDSPHSSPADLALDPIASLQYHAAFHHF